MIPFFGQMICRAVFSKKWTGLIYVVVMTSPSTPNKFQFGQDIVTFAGFEITMDHVKPCEKFIEAIPNFPTPTNIHSIDSWFGLKSTKSHVLLHC